MITKPTPRMYISTHAKNKSSFIDGKWLDLEDYSGAQDFEEACRELYSDEENPEFIVKDSDEVPDFLCSEAGLPKQELWDFFELEEGDQEIIEALIDCNISQDVEGALLKKDETIIYNDWDSIVDDFLERHNPPKGLARYINRDLIEQDLDAEGLYITLESERVLHVHY